MLLLHKLGLFLLVLGLLFEEAISKATLNNNGYDDFVVAISPDIPQDDSLIDSIKALMTNMSSVMYTATRKRAYLKTVKILLPKTWKHATDDTVSGESFQDAEFRIDNPNSAYGEHPYTQQSTDCGVPGDFTHITPSYLKNDAIKLREKTLLHEFAKLRWGVFEEHGYPGDDKFPMFYLKETWTAEGQTTIKKPNFCINNEIKGYEQDIVQGGPCTQDPSGSGLPDGRCIFYASQDTKATSSIMALPYLESESDFCDDSSEEFLHNTGIPTKQNLYCNSRSTWSVISESDDFSNNNNPPKNITNIKPNFIIIGGEKQVVSYVLVMDISNSMDGQSHPDRLEPMKDAAKRWINFDVAEGTSIGMLPFNAAPFPNLGFSMTVVDKTTKPMMIGIIDKMTTETGTCICDGLVMAVEDSKYLNNKEGNAIILLTDGRQTNSCKYTYKQAQDKLVEKKIRLITIALGDKADEEIEGLALATGGKPYFVDDNSGPGDFSDAFTGSTTFQPADTISNTDMTIYQNTWEYKETLTAAFDVDASIGRDLTFRLEVKNGNANCQQNMKISLFEPDPSIRIDENFKCSKSNYGTFIHKLPDNATVGKWSFSVKSSEKYDSLTVRITSRSRTSSTDPIQTKCWIKTGEQELGKEVYLKLSAVAEVKQGTKPVIGARVRAYITRPSDGGVNPPLEMELWDNGSGADVISNDGVYSRFFTKYQGAGRYSVKCEVIGSNDTQINEGFIVSRQLKTENPDVPICCGSNALSSNPTLSKAGVFARSAIGGSFQAKQGDFPTSDLYPPARVTDLKVDDFCKGAKLSFTSPGDDYDSEEPVFIYKIKYSMYASNMTEDQFEIDSDEYLIELREIDLINNSTLTPIAGGSYVTLYLNSTLYQNGITYSFGMQAIDENGNKSPLSNIARGSCFQQSLITSTPTKQPTTTSTKQPKTTSTKQPKTTSTKQPTTTSTKQPTPTSTKQPTTTSSKQPTPTATQQPSTPSTEQPTTPSTKRPSTTTTKQPKTTSTKQPNTTSNSTEIPPVTSTPSGSSRLQMVSIQSFALFLMHYLIKF